MTLLFLSAAILTLAGLIGLLVRYPITFQGKPKPYPHEVLGAAMQGRSNPDYWKRGRG